MEKEECIVCLETINLLSGNYRINIDESNLQLIFAHSLNTVQLVKSGMAVISFQLK
jgi:hypothetical protein